MDGKPTKRNLSTAQRVCNHCGAVVPVDPAVAREPWQGAWFREECRQSMAEEDLEELRQELALRGVPLS